MTPNELHTNQESPDTVPISSSQIEGREWWLWALAVTVTLVLTFGIVSLTFFSCIPDRVDLLV